MKHPSNTFDCCSWVIFFIIFQEIYILGCIIDALTMNNFHSPGLFQPITNLETGYDMTNKCWLIVFRIVSAICLAFDKNQETVQKFFHSILEETSYCYRLDQYFYIIRY